MGVLPFFELFWSYIDGIDFAFCNDDFETPLSLVIIIPLVIGILLGISVIIVFGMLTFCYIKKNTLQGNVEVKQSVILLFQFIVSMISLFVFVLL